MSPQYGNHEREARNSTLTLPRRLEICRTFYRSVVGIILQSSAEPTPHTTESAGSLIPDHTSHTTLIHPVLETFQCSEYHKCYAVQTGPYQLFTLFISAVPNHSIRAISKRTLASIIRDKQSNVIK
ncbi:protein fuzzy [Eurytemora carolleeae]|uniref:protein fuzzy n=1 Tax=Eurytemora carolleeae TaxID=1294199 RepID=UPI000C765131|nr:protein fuzzy [Eurytemora carolleeae]|eukprot:XP_023342335.1 protein fuzzy-like [Eurytemora affinis]